ncbi:MAG: type II toxin-antitoxin system PemK/MazF family toxin [Patescibacteria group bacterium]|nr:type II toxin-antitoxin system PemK/MazF family toxin [Patescibacteria group bacterium]
MNNRVKLKQGDLCLFNLNPSTGHEFNGKRPAVVVQSDRQIRRSSLVTVIPLTSNLGNRVDDDIVIASDDKNKLISDSVIKVYDIISLDYQRFINKIGRVDSDILASIKKYLKKHFEI